MTIVKDTGLLKVGVNFPVEKATAEACIKLNEMINKWSMSEIRFGENGNSQPHITVTMGVVQEEYISDIIEYVGKRAIEIKNESIKFSPIYRENVTHRYVALDAILSDKMLKWRKMVAEDLARFFEKQSRMSGVPHLTIAAYNSVPNWDIDNYLTTISENIPNSKITAIDISIAGEKGIKKQIIKRVTVK